MSAMSPNQTFDIAQVFGSAGMPLKNADHRHAVCCGISEDKAQNATSAHTSAKKTSDISPLVFEP
jgi:hypothetical protein